MKLKRGIILILSLLLTLPCITAFSGIGSGTIEDPYQITNCEELQEVNSDTSTNYILNNDIDCSDTVNWNNGQGFLPINTYRGTLNGNGYEINRLYINRPSKLGVGLFESMRGSVYNLALTNVNITGNRRVGGIAGENWGGEIYECYVSGQVKGTYGGITKVGLLVGDHQKDYGSIRDCYTRGSVSGHSYIGGLVGYSQGPITRCYSTAAVSGDEIIGGLIGDIYEVSFSDSFSTGSVSGTQYVGGLLGIKYSVPDPTNSYWNNHAGNPDSSAGGIAINNDESYFKNKDNAPMTSWDFTNIWSIDPNINNGYPFLISSIQTPDCDIDCILNKIKEWLNDDTTLIDTLDIINQYI